MISNNQYYKDGVYYGSITLYGNSSDTKPICYGNGSKFIECDTGDVYVFDAESGDWALSTHSTFTYVSGMIDESPKEIGELDDGDWVCALVYPLNLDITVATDDENKVVVTSESYRGAVAALCFKV